MIEEYPVEKRLDLLPLFKNHNYLRLLLESLLREGIGTLHVNNKDKPTVAIAGQKIIYFLAGDSSDPSVPELLKIIETQRLIFIPNDEWLRTMKAHWGDKLMPYPRTKFSSENLDINHMQEIQKALPEGLVIEKLTEETIKNISKLII